METRTKKLTNTSVGTLDECRYKYWLRYVLGIMAYVVGLAQLSPGQINRFEGVEHVSPKLQSRPVGHSVASGAFPNL